MYLSAPNREMVSQIVENERASVQAAAYTIYLQIKPNNKKAMTPREFHKEFTDNWGCANSKRGVRGRSREYLGYFLYR